MRWKPLKCGEFKVAAARAKPGFFSFFCTQIVFSRSGTVHSHGAALYCPEAKYFFSRELQTGERTLGNSVNLSPNSAELMKFNAPF
jgi:hypothetical protein